MMSWETELMKEHARLICHNKGSVLNVGHGMGIVDRAIQVILGSFRPNKTVQYEKIKFIPGGWPDTFRGVLMIKML